MIEAILSAFEKFMLWVRGISRDLPSPPPEPATKCPGHVPPHPMPVPAPALESEPPPPPTAEPEAPAPAPIERESEPEPIRAPPAIAKRGAPRKAAPVDDESTASLDDFLKTVRQAMKILADRRCSLPNDMAGGYRITREDLSTAMKYGVLFPFDGDLYRSVGMMTEAEAKSQKVDVSRGLPSFLAIANVNPDGQLRCDDGEPQSEGIWIIKQLDRLRPGVFPTGPGYPFEIQFIWHLEKNYRDMKAGNCGLSHYFTVDSDGGIHRVAYWQKSRTEIKTRRNGVVRIPHMTRSTEALFDNLRPNEKSHMSFEERIAFLFRCWSWMDSQWQARFTGSDGTVIIGSSPQGLKRVFRRKDRRVERSGRIVHWVSAHQRTGTRPVRTHIRGERVFNVDGYRVALSLPGKHIQMRNSRSIIEFLGEEVTADPVHYRFAGSKLMRLLSRADLETAKRAEQARQDAIELGHIAPTLEAVDRPEIIRYTEDLDEAPELMAEVAYMESFRRRESCALPFFDGDRSKESKRGAL